MILLTQKLCMLRDIGIHGNLFGGTMISWIDEAAATYAAQICHTPNMVTVKIEEIVFQKAVKAGQQIKIYAEVEKVGNTSIALSVEAKRYNVYSTEEIVVCSTRIVFVRIDEVGEAVPIPQLVKDRYSHE